MDLSSWLTKKRGVIFTIILVLGGLNIGIIICEILLRIFYPQQLYSFEQHLFVESDDYEYCLTPNIEKLHTQPEYSYTIRSNSFGFRGKEPNFKANYRVLVLGDSVGMGQGVPEGINLCELSQRYFNKHHVDTDIFNTSISGYSGVNEILVLKKFLKTYRPNLVVLLFNWNDIGVTESLFVKNGFLVLSYGNKYTAPLREWMNNHSHFYCLIKKFYYLRIKEAPDKLGSRKLPDEEIRLSFNNIDAMKGFCDSYTAEFVVVLLPLHGIYEGTPKFRERKQILSDMLHGALINYVDWATVLPKENKNKLVFNFDHHWNERGHVYFSKFLTNLIIKSNQGNGAVGQSKSKFDRNQHLRRTCR